MVIRVTAQGTTRVQRITSVGTTIVKSVTVGTPSITGAASTGTVGGLDDVNTSARQDGYILKWDSDNTTHNYVDPSTDVRSQIDAADNGGDGSFTYDSSTGVFAYTGPSPTEVTAHFRRGGDLAYDSSVGKFTFNLSDYTTDSVAEGTNNLYYTRNRFDSALQSISTNLIPDSNQVYDIGDSNYRFKDLWLKGTTIHLGSITVNDSDGLLTVKDSLGSVAPFNLQANTTTDLAEGTNLYYTDARARSSISITTNSTGQISYDSSTGILTFNDSNFARTDIQDVYHEGIAIPDTKKIVFANNLADIFENDGNFFIRKTNENLPGGSGGNIFLMTRDSGFLYIKSFDGDRDLAHFHDQGPVQLFHKNTIRFATTDSGARVYGNFNFDTLRVLDSATIDGNLNVGTNLIVSGDLTVDGTTTTINSTTLSVNDKNIVLADSAADSNAANGAGITVGGAGASITYDHTNATWDFNRPFGNDINLIQNFNTANLSEGTNLYYTQTRFDSAFGDKSTTNLSEGNNLYYLTSRADSDFDVRLATKTTSNLTEGTNLYYTTTRFDSDLTSTTSSTTIRNYFSASGDLNYNSGTGQFSISLSNFTTDSVSEGTTNLYYTTARFDSDFGDNNTDQLTEGSTNLYYTSARFDSDLGTTLTINTIRGYFSATGDLSYDQNTGAFLLDLNNHNTDSLPEGNTNLYYTTARFDSDFNDNNTNQLSEGTNNLYYTTVRVDSDIDAAFAAKSTTNLSEGTNLYYTTARADSDARHAVSGGGDISYDPSTGIISIDVEQIYTFDNFDSDFRQRLTTTTTDSIGEGSTNLYYTTARADSDARYALQVTDNGGDGSLSYHAPTGVISYTGPSAAEVRAHFSATGDINYDSSTGIFSIDVEDVYSKANFDSDLGDANTDLLPEGSTNLYYTTARADSDAKRALQAGTSIVYTASTGTIATVQAIDSTDDVKFNTITNKDGTTTQTPSAVAVSSGTATILDQFAHNSSPVSFEYLIHLYDSDNTATQITKMIGTFDGTNIASNEFGTVFTGSDYMGELDFDLSGSNIRLLYTKEASLGTISTKAIKTIIS